MAAPPHVHRRAIGAALVVALLALAACGDLSAALPPRPSPFPTLERLPSVTPVTPSPTAPPTLTPTVGLAPTPTPAPLQAEVVTGANVRAGPGLEFAIVAVAAPGDRVDLSGRSANWFLVRTAAGVEGWMAQSVLTIDPEIEAAVPVSEP